VVPRRRHRIALLTAVALLAASASLVVTWRQAPTTAAAIEHDAATLTRHAAPSNAVAGRVVRTGDQLVNADLRPHRLTGLTIVAVLLVLAAHVRPGRHRLRRGQGASAPEIAAARIAPPRAPPLLPAF
jgi:hypothetical protein